MNQTLAEMEFVIQECEALGFEETARAMTALTQEIKQLATWSDTRERQTAPLRLPCGKNPRL